MRTYEKHIERRLDALRAGQAAGEVAEFLSDSETRLVLVPLTDGEYLKALSLADKLDITNGPAGLAMSDETLRKGIIFYAAREMRDWTIPFFEDISEVEALQHHEVNHFYDIYSEMVQANSPSLPQLSDEDIEDLKKVWSWIEWNELTGPQWYAAKRFLDSMQPILLKVSLSGSHSTPSLTPKSETEQPAVSA